MNENKPTQRKLYKITTHNIMIETFEVIAESKEEAELAVFDLPIIVLLCPVVI